MHDYGKICRICMSSGSRDMFHRSNIDSNSPLERLLEKMRYVTMMKIEENDDLPRLICDLCIVQLNVAYNFKRQAVENDTKLRQYFIEHGITSHTPVQNDHTNISNTNNTNNTNSNTNNVNTATINSETSNVRNTYTPTNNAVNTPIIRRITNSFPIMPIIVKTEPEILIDDLSDSVMENNISANPNGPLTESSISTGISNNINLSNNASSSMVYLNGYSINTLTPSSEVESYHNINTNNTVANDVIQLSRGSMSSFELTRNEMQSEVGKSKNSVNKNLNVMKRNGKSLNSAEITRKKIAQKRFGGQLKTRRIMPERSTKNEIDKNLSTLRIDMAPPSGKISREEMKRKLYFGSKKKSDSSEQIKTILNENSKNKSTGNLHLNPSIVLNPFNHKQHNSISNKIPTGKKKLSPKNAANEKNKIVKSNKPKYINKLSCKSRTDTQRTQIKLIELKIEPSSKN